MYYPSIGNRNYIYAEWRSVNPEYVWELLKTIGVRYNNICRSLRNIYKWTPQTIDDIEVVKLIQIYEETVEDNKNDKEQKNEYNDPDYLG